MFFLPAMLSLGAVVPAVLVLLGVIGPVPGINMPLFLTISVTVFVGLIVLYYGYSRKLARKHASDLLTAEMQINAMVTEKYGITLSEPSVSIYDVGRGAMSVTKHGIRAKNANGEEVLVSIRLTDNNTDLVAYCNGKEFKRLNQRVSK